MKRYLTYLQQRFPLLQNLLFATLIGISLQITLQLGNGGESPVIGTGSLAIVLTITGFMLLMRLFDDLKDARTDGELFPDRPLPKGNATPKMLWIMILGIHLFFHIPVFLFPEARLWFLMSLAFAWLSFRWFFAPRFISTRLLLAFITHQPAGFFVNLWVAAATLSLMNLPFNATVLMPCFIFITPVMLWELSRKIKPEGEENDYTTYSKILGPRTAAAVLLLPGSVLTGGLIVMAEHHGIPTLHTGLQALFFVIFTLAVYRFMLKPVRKHQVLAQASVLLSLCSLILYMAFLLIFNPPQWQWF